MTVDNLFHCSVHSLLLNASNAFSMSNAPLDRNYHLGKGCVYILEGLRREEWIYKIIPFLIQRSESRENGTFFSSLSSFFLFFLHVLSLPFFAFFLFFLFPHCQSPILHFISSYFSLSFFLLPKYAVSLKQNIVQLMRNNNG